MAKREVPEINSSSMADIAFMLLIFFLVATTMDIDTGLARMLPPPAPPDIDNKAPLVQEKNIFVVLINKNDQLLVEGRPIELDFLKDQCKEFLQKTDQPNFPDSETKEISLIGRFPVSKGVVSLQNDRGTTYGRYIEVQNALVAAYNEVRDELSMEKFGRKFDELSEESQKAIKEAIPQRISEAEPKRIGGK
ncbi:MAG: biopolymer transporter ExbD [Bacteroidales bacterium]|nr:biopolymer transporter ExbD [Bacteroidales bacterium]